MENSRNYEVITIENENWESKASKFIYIKILNDQILIFRKSKISNIEITKKELCNFFILWIILPFVSKLF